MDPVRFRPEPPLVADASVWINLVAGGARGGRAARLGETHNHPEHRAWVELERGRERGRSAYAGITPLIAAGYVTVIDLPEAAEGHLPEPGCWDARARR